jgi:hypothetical protein
MSDEIIRELWRIKDELAREANYDVHVLCREFRKKPTTSTSQIVDRSAIFIASAKGMEEYGQSKD